MLVDMYAVIGNNYRQIPCALCLVTPDGNILWKFSVNQNQDIESSMVKILPKEVWFYLSKDLSCWPFIAIPLSSYPCIPVHWLLATNIFFLHFYCFVISRMLYKWNDTLYNFWRLSFSIQHDGDSSKLLCVIPFGFWVVFCGHRY